MYASTPLPYNNNKPLHRVLCSHSAFGYNLKLKLKREINENNYKYLSHSIYIVYDCCIMFYI